MFLGHLSNPVSRNNRRAALEFNWQSGLAHIGKVDAKMDKIIRLSNSEPFEVERYRSPFSYLARAIIFQQLSGHAARAILGRFQALFGGKNRVTAKNLTPLKDEDIRAAGLSFGKIKALRSLGQHALDGKIPGWAKLEKMPDDEIIETLTDVHGIGVWTVEMLLLFQLGRPDVLPVGDLGVRNGYAIAHGLKERPTPGELKKLAESWSPYSSVGTWYCWRAVDLKL